MVTTNLTYAGGSRIMGFWVGLAYPGLKSARDVGGFCGPRSSVPTITLEMADDDLTRHPV